MAIDTRKREVNHEYYCLINDVQLGPYDIVTLVSKISRDTLVWREGIEWEKACNVEELSKFFPEPQVVVVQAPVSHSAPQSSSNQIAPYTGLYRSQDEKVFTGFCGGLAHKYKMNVALVRVIVFFSFSLYVGWFYFAGLFFPKYPTKNI
jgi:phage shock protein PspC (stress-responsive transcriptional regulator)